MLSAAEHEDPAEFGDPVVLSLAELDIHVVLSADRGDNHWSTVSTGEYLAGSICKVLTFPTCSLIGDARPHWSFLSSLSKVAMGSDADRVAEISGVFWMASVLGAALMGSILGAAWVAAIPIADSGAAASDAVLSASHSVWSEAAVALHADWAEATVASPAEWFGVGTVFVTLSSRSGSCLVWAEPGALSFALLSGAVVSGWLNILGIDSILLVGNNCGLVVGNLRHKEVWRPVSDG